MENNICKVIQEKNMNQGDLAQMVGVRREYINRIINRKIVPSVYLGMRIADALEVPMERLFILGERQFNNEVQHLGKQKGKCYPKWLWKNTSN